MWDSVMLSIVQGLSEFLPVSSSGHLVILGHWLRDRSSASLEGGPVFEAVVHLGTLIAVMFFLRRELIDLFARLFGFRGRAGLRSGWRLAGMIVVATIPVGVVGLMYKSVVERAFRNPSLAALMLIVTGVVLMTTRRRGARAAGAEYPLAMERMGLHSALWIGLAQAVAIIPGISRSGMTISAALLVGLRRDEAARFSFLISVPAILGAAVVQFKDCAPRDILTLEMGLSFAVAAVCGLLALRCLAAVLRMERFHLFAYYVIPAGALALAVLQFSG